MSMKKNRRLKGKKNPLSLERWKKISTTEKKVVSELENQYDHYESPDYDTRYVPGAHFDNWMNG